MCSAPSLKDLDLTDVTTVAVDLETYDPSLKKHGSGAIRGEGFVCGIAIATDKQTVYYPIAHAMTDNLDPTTTWKYLNEKLFQNENIAKVFHNAMYDVCWIRAVTGMMPKGQLLDTMIAASVLDETRMRYSLDSISKDYLKESKYKYDLQEKSLAEFGIKDPMSNMHKLSYSLVKDYAEQDVNLTLKLWNIFEKKLNQVLYINTDTNENKTCKNIFDLETKLFPCLVAVVGFTELMSITVAPDFKLSKKSELFITSSIAVSSVNIVITTSLSFTTSLIELAISAPKFFKGSALF